MNGTKTRARPREDEDEDEGNGDGGRVVEVAVAVAVGAEATVRVEANAKAKAKAKADGATPDTAPATAPAPTTAPAPAPALPPTVEGRECTEAEMAAKRANGAYYLDDIWRIVREYPTAGVFDCPGELETLPRRLDAALDAVGYRVVEASARFEGLVHATQLAQAWAQLVHDARNSETLYLVRRTAGNTGALLALQRIEHLRGECTEHSPLALVALVRGEQRLYPRHEVPAPPVLDALLLALVGSEPNDALAPAVPAPAVVSTAVPAPESTAAAAPAPPPAPAHAQARSNIPPDLFARQMTALATMMGDLGVQIDDGADGDVDPRADTVGAVGAVGVGAP